MALITATDIQARLSAEDYLKVFDRDGDGAADPAFVATAIGDAQSEVDMRLFAALGGTTLEAAGGTPDTAVKAATVWRAVHHGLLGNPILTDSERAPFAAAIKWADTFLDRLTKDLQNRLVTSAAGRAHPRPRTSQTTTPDGVATDPFGRARDGSDGTSF